MSSSHGSYHHPPLPEWAQPADVHAAVEGVDLRFPSRTVRPTSQLIALIEDVAARDLAAAPYLELSEAMSEAFAVDVEETYVGVGISRVFHSICQAFLREGDRVGIVEPTPDWVKRGILAVGAAYVDIGRDWRMNPLESSLARLCEDDQLRMLFTQAVSSVTGTIDHDKVAIPSHVLWVQGHTYARHITVQGEGIHLVDVSQREGALGLPLCLGLGSVEHIRTLRRLEPTTTLSARTEAMGIHHLKNRTGFDARCVAWSDLRQRLARATAHLHGIHMAGIDGPAVMIRHPTLSNMQLAERLALHRVYVTAVPSHTHHDHIVMGLPTKETFEAVVDGLTTVWP
jgi:histidinol-phosphate/aromatic aminotransferase/cobyric acid decarboxylase-like protein